MNESKTPQKPVERSKPVDTSPERAVERASFWRVAYFRDLGEEADRQQLQVPESIASQTAFHERELVDREKGPPPTPPLVPWSRLWPFLKHALSCERETREPDVELVGRKIAQGEPLRRLPKCSKRAWSSRIHIFIERRDDLSIFWDDFAFLVSRLKDLLGDLAVSVEYVVCANGEVSKLDLKSGRKSKLIVLESNDCVLALSDFGFLSGNKTCQRSWISLGRKLTIAGVRIWGLTPAPRELWESTCSGLWNLVLWDGGSILPRGGKGLRPLVLDDEGALQRSQGKERLLELLSLAIRIERGLLRSVRLLLPADVADAGTEYEIRNDSSIAYGGPLAFSLEAEPARALREVFSAKAGDLELSAASLIRDFHRYYPEAVEAMETLVLLSLLSPADSERFKEAGLIGEEWEKRALSYLERATRTLYEDNANVPTSLTRSFAQWARQQWERLPSSARRNDVMQWLWALQKNVACRNGLKVETPPEIEAGKIAWTDMLRQGEARWAICIRNGSIRCSMMNSQGLRENTPHWATDFILRTSRENIAFTCTGKDDSKTIMALLRDRGKIEFGDFDRLSGLSFFSGRQTYFADRIPRPRWARRMGVDRFGLYADLDIPGLLPQRPLRMRWIPPGRFTMGSPEDEAGRSGDEGPQHEVTLTDGYWLAEAPMTQEQWWVLSSDRKEPSHFEESDERRNLPVDSVSWEDCQALCDGIAALIGEGIDWESRVFRPPTEAEWEYACRAGTDTAFYDGSSCSTLFGEDPALEELVWHGQSSDKGTEPVKGKAANIWGLYDMHGNVLEWCHDWYHDYEDKKLTNPFGAEFGEGRVSRGGCYANGSKACRSAYRFKFPPVFRNRDVGFRLALGQPLVSYSKQGSFLQAASIEGGTPPDEATAETKPVWALREERNEFERYADLALSGRGADGPVMRMRWVEPGSFMMGSPKDETGRSADETRRQVTLTKGFWLAETPCTQEQWQAVMGRIPSSQTGSDDLPVESISWLDCQEFIEALGKTHSEMEARLPTEAEWEYACRAGTNTAFNDGSPCTEPSGRDPALDKLGWFDKNSGVETHPVKMKKANEWGFHDMHGNVWEWCNDWYGSIKSVDVVDPTGPRTGEARVLRGGGVWYDAQLCRSASRIRGGPDYRNRLIGFRLALGQSEVSYSQPSGARRISKQAEGGTTGAARDRESGAGRLTDRVKRLFKGKK
ncbi:MAG: formylglycine-generating enzyme family protein [Verrucomicrobiota bacterium]